MIHTVILAIEQKIKLFYFKREICKRTHCPSIVNLALLLFLDPDNACQSLPFLAKRVIISIFSHTIMYSKLNRQDGIRVSNWSGYIDITNLCVLCCFCCFCVWHETLVEIAVSLTNCNMLCLLAQSAFWDIFIFIFFLHFCILHHLGFWLNSFP